jgi:hypothetical protein
VVGSGERGSGEVNSVLSLNLGSQRRAEYNSLD